MPETPLPIRGHRRLAPVVAVRRTQPTPTVVYDTFWRFACERQHVFNRRLAGDPAPWTGDPILHAHRFTNAYRASDRVSQYLIRHVIYRSDLPDSPDEVVFRILLFKLFNRIETWELLEQAFGAITLRHFRFDNFAKRLALAREEGRRLYSAAYIMPSTGPLLERVKHRGHLRLVEQMLASGVAASLAAARSLDEAFRLLWAYPTLGPFLAFQLAIDVNYSLVMSFPEMDFVMPGPGALDGLHKCFSSFGGYGDADVIRWVTDHQEDAPAKLGLSFPTLYGRPLQLIDVQNLFCEVSKYARLAHPEVRGTNTRLRIKQVYRTGLSAPQLFFPPKWRINQLIPADARAPENTRRLKEPESLFEIS